MMKHNVPRIIAVLFILAACSAWGFGAEARIVLGEIKGKVEVKGMNDAAWTPAQEGMAISTLTTVSTGFDSTVTVTMDKNKLYVKPLTRITVDKLIEEQGSVATSCYLRVGNVKASIKSAEGVKQDFKVQSPYSTASVRGTEFEFDGLRLAVSEGSVGLLPGRPVREIQAVAAVAAGSESVTVLQSALDDDFIGSPSTPSIAAAPIIIKAGSSAVLSLGLNGSFKSVRSGDKASLASSTTVQISSADPSSIKAPLDTRKLRSKSGSVTVTIVLP